MLTSLRRIRKSLIESSSARKYLLYAIGEIALVVIGILIALQINNWNEARKDRQTEQAILLNLNEDFLNNQQILNIQNEDMETQIEEIEFLLRIRPDEISDSLILFDLFNYYYGLRVVTFQPSQSTLEETISSGNLKLLRSNRLRKNLTIWISILDEAKEHESKIINLKELELRPFLIKCCPRGVEFQGDYVQILADYKFRNIMELFQIMLETQMEKRVRLQEIVDQILINLEETIL